MSSPARRSACRPASRIRRRPSRGRISEPIISDRDAVEIQRMVIHRDDHVIVLNKPPGLAVQGGSGTEKHIDGMLDALRFGFEQRPRLVHRLDKDTSGLLLIARTGPGGQAAGRVVPRSRDRKALLGDRGRRAAEEGGRDRPAAGQAAGRTRSRADAGRRGERPEGADPFPRARQRRPSVPRCWRCGRAPGGPISCASIARRSAVRSWATASTAARKRCCAAVADARRLHLHARRLLLPHPSGKGELKVEAELPPHFRRTVEAFGFSTDGV